MKKQTKFKQTEIGMIPEDWEVKELNEVASYITEKINLDEINTNNFISTENMLSEKGGVTLSSSLPKVGKVTQFKEGDILFSNIRTYFKKLWLAKFSGGCSNDVLVIRKKSFMNDKYLYYYLSQDHFFEFTILTSKGTKMPRGDKNSIMSYEINIPPIYEQSAIAKILSYLDSKIELNQQINKTLEAIGQAIFKHWFVDFEFPNEKDKPYKSSGGEMVESELGEIPRWWKIGNILNEFNLTMGQSPPGSTYNETAEGISFFQGRTDFGFRFPTKRIFCTSPARFAEHGDTLVSVRAPVGDINMATEKCCVGRGVAGIRHKTGSRSYTYYAMQNLRENFLHFEAEGTVFGSIGKTDFEKIKLIIPSKEIISLFEKVLYFIDQKIENNFFSNESLSQIRDSLLPRLMSGKIRVPVEVSNG